ncbi:hypothetical protein B0J18DRAFT_43050 [Chaetomium sp. MPI-SDFR-AT-0129]|nr:hypothetical protein B0J18DRAFT_43050 [Chaetomium sp. MPI-SDFR-AT-0129]
MSERYSAEFLLHLRDSPLCVKPPNLPPAEEWMGPPPETFRNQQKAAGDRHKPGDGGALLNQDNKRPTHDRNGSRNSANPDEIILGPPRTSFASASATSMRGPRNGEAEKGFRDTERNDRFNFRNRTGDSENPADRFSRDTREGRNNGFRRRTDQDQDNEGWSTVKPRKSFGHEGAERFHGRMGGVGNDRFAPRDDTRRTRDRDDRDGGDRRSRNFEHRPRDQEGDEPETPRRNGLPRGKTESWFRDNAAGSSSEAAPPLSQRERIDRAKSWRDRDPEDKPNDRYGDRNDKGYDRRWDRDRHARVENDPEWLDEPLEEKTQSHTEDDLKKFLDSMKAGRSGGAPKPEEKANSGGGAFDQPLAPAITEEHKVVSAPAVESGPDKFFAAYGNSGIDAGTPTAEAKDAAKPKAGKSSRFMAFLAPQEETKARTEPPTPAAVTQPSSGPAPAQQSDADKEAFALLIQKLQRSGFGPALQSGAPPAQTPPDRFPETSPFQGFQQQQKSAVASPEPFQQYGNGNNGGERRDDPRMRGSQHSIHDMISPRPAGLPMPPPPATRPEQALQDLLAQRHLMPSQSSTRSEQQNMVAVNRNREFLVGLMQGQRESPDHQRAEQHHLMRMPQPTKQVSLANVPDREQDYPRERSASQRQQMRGAPPGFLEENQFHPGDIDARPPMQPTQILQRPPPPGLEHQMPPFHMGGVNPGAGGGQMPPQRPMIPPPGLMNNGPRNMPMPGMFPPNFPPTHGHSGPGNFPPGPPPPHAGGPPPPDGMGGPPPGPPRSMQPPPGFFGGPPPGFMPPPGMVGGGSGFPGPDGPQGGPNPGLGPGPGHGAMGGGFGGLPSPFERLERMGGMDRRGMMPPPPGGFRGA